MKFDNLARLFDEPEGLWGTHHRYVEAGYPQRMSRPASLYLVQPDMLGPLRIWSEATSDGQRRYRRRVYLHYRRTLHEFDITDPDLQMRYYPKVPSVDEPSLNIALRDAKRTAVCVSLTPVWQGRHYKIAAAFIEPPQEVKVG